MSKLGTAFRVGASILAGVGGVATVADVVVNNIQPAQTQVVEEYNYEQDHIINISNNYKIIIDGEEIEVSYDEWLSTKQSFEVLDNTPITFYCGALDTNTVNSINLSELTKVELTNTPKEYTVNIKSGNVETEEGQYPIIVIPDTYSIKVSVAGFGDMFDLISETSGYRIYVFNGTYGTYDEDCGGVNYTIKFIKNVQ